MDVLFTSHKYVIGCPIGMCKIRHRDDNGVAQGDRSKTKNYSTVNKL